MGGTPAASATVDPKSRHLTSRPHCKSGVEGCFRNILAEMLVRRLPCPYAEAKSTGYLGNLGLLKVARSGNPLPRRRQVVRPAKLFGGAMSVPKARVVRGLVVTVFVATCLASGAVTSAFARGDGGGGSFGGFHGGFGGFHGCFNCGFRGGFGFGFAPAWGGGWGWGWPGWGWGWPGWSWGWPGWGWGWPGWGWGSSSGWGGPGWGWSTPSPYAGGGSPYAGGGSPYAGGGSPYAGGWSVTPPTNYDPRPSGRSCYAGPYVCPLDHPVPSGSGCYCLSNNRTHVPGRAN
jgi:hypothetical protein